MTLQDLVDQTWHAIKRTSWGIMFSLFAASAPAYGNGINSYFSSQPAHRGAFPAPLAFDTGLHTVGGDYPVESGGDPVLPKEDPSSLEQFISRLPPAQQRQFSLLAKKSGFSEDSNNAESYDIDPAKVFEESSKVVARVNEVLSFPSLDELHERYRPVKYNGSPGPLVYKAEFLPGYYVHYPQARRIYYVERGNVVGKGRTTITHSIADENGTILFRANELGEMVRVQSQVVGTSSNQNISSQPAKEINVKQPTVVDIGVFQNMFDCQSKLELYSKTGAGVGSLAIIGPLAAALYIRHRRRKSRHK